MTTGTSKELSRDIKIIADSSVRITSVKFLSETSLNESILHLADDLKLMEDNVSFKFKQISGCEF